MCAHWGSKTLAFSTLGLFVAASPNASGGLVDLELRPVTETVIVGGTVEIGLYAVSADGNDQSVGFVGTVVTWDASTLVLTGNSDEGAFAWTYSGFPSDPAGLNDTFSDGDAYYQAVVSEEGPLATATAEGSLVTTLLFTALPDATGATSIAIVLCIEETCTVVLDRHPFQAGVEDVTGSLGTPVEVTILCETDSHCDDENPCTDDTCDESDMCGHTPNDTNDPDDGLFCNGHEICDGGQVVIEEGSIPDCDDGLACTFDSCNETTDQCDHALEDGYCLIGGYCYTDGSINPANECEACGPSSDPENWSPRPAGASCGDPTETECNHADTCDGFGICEDNLELEGTACGDPSDTECTAPDTCDHAGICQPHHRTDGTTCDDGLFCTVADVCSAGLCVGSDLRCPDQVCDESTDKCKAVNPELRPVQEEPYLVDDTVEIELHVVSDTGTDQPISAISVIFTWDPSRLELQGNVDNGPYPWLMSGFPDDSGLDGLNDTFLDGNALYEALVLPAPNPPAVATSDGLLVSTFQFLALATGTVQIEMIDAFGQSTMTTVVDGETFGLDITGTLGPPALIDIVECLDDGDCDDGEFCTGVERCIDAVCVAGTPPDCDDGLFCNGTEVCESGFGCVSPGNPCPDPDSCDENDDSCGGCHTPILMAEGSRYLVVTPTAGDDPVAILIKGDPADPTVSCVSKYVQPNGTVDTTPVFQTPTEWGTVHVGDEELAPSTMYIVYADCRREGSGYLSSPVGATTWLWGDVNNNGAVQVDDIILVFDGSQGVFSGGTTVENLDLAPCLPDGEVDADDIASVQDAYAGGSFPCPVACEACLSIDPPQAEPNGAPKNRNISFMSGNPGWRTAIRVRFSDLPPPHDAANGRTMWVGEPQEVSENAAKIDPSEAPGWPTFVAATLRCEPYYADWSALGTVHVYQEGIIPGAVYELQTIDEVCDIADDSNYSAPLQATTSLWGDIVKDCVTTPCGPPDGSVDVVTDVTAVLDKFRNLVGAPIKAKCDLEPDRPDLIINIADVTYILDAFRGFEYPFEGPRANDPCAR